MVKCGRHHECIHACMSAHIYNPVFREVDSGLSVTAYFIATGIMSVFEDGSQMIIVGTLSYWLRAPLQSYFSYVSNFFMLQWGMISWGHLLTVLIPPDNLTIINATMLVCAGLLCCGISKPVTMEGLYNSKVVAIFAGLMSPMRYFVETLVVSDLRCLPEQYGFTKSNSTKIPDTALDVLHFAMDDESARYRSCDGWYYGALRLFVIGLMLRVLTLLFIQVTYRRQKLQCRLMDRNKWALLSRGLLIAIFASLLYTSILLIV